MNISLMLNSEVFFFFKYFISLKSKENMLTFFDLEKTKYFAFSI